MEFMYLNKKLLVGLLVLVSSNLSLADQTLQDLKGTVPEGKLAQEKELRDLDFINERLKLVLSISQSQQGIRNTKVETGSESTKVYIDEANYLEDQIRKSLLQPSENGSPAKSNVIHTSRKNTFNYDISLLSIWGTGKAQRADILINGKQIEIRPKSIVAGWEVVSFNTQFVELKNTGNAKNIARVYYSVRGDE